MRASIVNHRHFEDRIIRYIDGELSPEERARCDEHLRVCPRCRERVDVLREAWHSDALLPVAGPTLRLRTRFEAALRGEEETGPGLPVGKRMDWLARPAMLAATLAAGVLIGAYLGSGPNGATAPVEQVPAQTSVLAYSFADDLREISAEPVEQDILLLDWDVTGDETVR